MMRCFILLMVAVSLIAPSAAREWGPHCETGRDGKPPVVGFSFYCDAEREKTPPKNKSTPPPTSSDQPPPDSARAKIAVQRAELEESLAVALLSPNRANVVRYIQLQRQHLDKSSLFADVWSRALLTEPGLDYGAEYPLSTVGKRAQAVAFRQQREAFLQEINTTHDFLYVGKQNCAVCRAYGPILRDIANRNSMNVLAVSADGSPLNGWPEAVIDRGQLASLGVSLWAVPMTAVFNRRTNKIQVLGYGFLAEEQIIENLHRLLARKPGEGT